MYIFHDIVEFFHVVDRFINFRTWMKQQIDWRLIHTKWLRHKCSVDGDNGYASHSARHSVRQKNQGAACQRYGDGDGVVRCE